MPRAACRHVVCNQEAERSRQSESELTRKAHSQNQFLLRFFFVASQFAKPGSLGDRTYLKVFSEVEYATSDLSNAFLCVEVRVSSAVSVKLQFVVSHSFILADIERRHT